MSTFSYSIDQIDKIFESASRCGQLKKDWLKLNDYDVDVLYSQLAATRKELKKERAKAKKTKDNDKEEELQEKLEENLEEKSYVERVIKEEVLHNIIQRNYSVHVERKYHNDSGKYIYVTGKDRDSFFACKMINDELQKTYKIKQPDRNVILKNLKLLLLDHVDKMIVRGDIKSFFESIPYNELLETLEKDGIVSRRTIKIMKRMFYELNHNEDFEYIGGVPRGISFSPSLAGIYLRRIDEQISRLDGVYLYQRYVDDVIIIASPTQAYPSAKILFSKVEDIFREGKLFLHPEGDSKKYMAQDIRYDTPQKIVFDYLGYNITLNTSKLKVTFRLTADRMEKYAVQIGKVIDYYMHLATYNPRSKEKNSRIVIRHRQPLYRFKKLLAYLTCNYTLGGTKSNILSGIYFKHSMLTDTSQLKQLDQELYREFEAKIKQSMFNGKFIDAEFVNKLRKKLHDDYSFEKGFAERRMSHLTSAEFRMIKHILQYEEAKD
ncbi:antiviral reverse transcriptase Drt3a [Prevotella sp. HMSC077E09]|uniref:antiviral reverse transcriptase Drt3a n=1 Tax=Prevotella sp. HMSC077E09 TaxID=1739487 RepID=UPI0009F222AF|nr:MULTISPECIES: antiviral reverse transcriptase Drt3a [unclassified Prevotella]